jgi:hypothetical protein
MVSLGDLVLRRDIDRWIRSLDAVGGARRAELIASIALPALAELVRLVDDFGGPSVLDAVDQARVRLRRQKLAELDEFELPPDAAELSTCEDEAQARVPQ